MFEVIIASDEDQDPRRRATPRPARRRRTAAVPKHLQNELGRKFPYRLRADAEGYEIHYRRGGWTALIGDRDQAIGLRVRETFAWIVRGDDKVAAVAFREFSAPHTSAKAFLRAMDGEDGDYGGLASAILSGWPDLAIMRYGPVLELSYVWARLGENALALLRPAVAALLKRLPKDYSVLVSHAVPLEYLDDDLDEGLSSLGFQRRLSAIKRVAARELNLQPIPGEAAAQDYLARVRPGLEGDVGAATSGSAMTR